MHDKYMIKYSYMMKPGSTQMLTSSAFVSCDWINIVYWSLNIHDLCLPSRGRKTATYQQNFWVCWFEKRCFLLLIAERGLPVMNYCAVFIRLTLTHLWRSVCYLKKRFYLDLDLGILISLCLEWDACLLVASSVDTTLLNNPLTLHFLSQVCKTTLLDTHLWRSETLSAWFPCWNLNICMWTSQDVNWNDIKKSLHEASLSLNFFRRLRKPVETEPFRDFVSFWLKNGLCILERRAEGFFCVCSLRLFVWGKLWKSRLR